MAFLVIVALCDLLCQKLDLYLDGTAVFLWNEVETMVTISNIRGAHVARG